MLKSVIGMSVESKSCLTSPPASESDCCRLLSSSSESFSIGSSWLLARCSFFVMVCFAGLGAAARFYIRYVRVDTGRTGC